MPEEKKLLMVTISGTDRPGITSALIQVLMKHNVEIVDIEQASLQKLFGPYFLLDLGDAGESKDSVIKDLLFEASQLNLNLNFKRFAPVRWRPSASKTLTSSPILEGQKLWSISPSSKPMGYVY